MGGEKCRPIYSLEKLGPVPGQRKHEYPLPIVHDVSQGEEGLLIPRGDEVGTKIWDVEENNGDGKDGPQKGDKPPVQKVQINCLEI